MPPPPPSHLPSPPPRPPARRALPLASGMSLKYYCTLSVPRADKVARKTEEGEEEMKRVEIEEDCMKKKKKERSRGALEDKGNKERLTTIQVQHRKKERAKGHWGGEIGHTFCDIMPLTE